MKETICFIDTNEKYVKKLNNYAIKKYGKDYLFLCFSNVKSLIDYTEDNKVKSVVLSHDFEKDIKYISSKFYYVQTEKKGESKKDGNIKYIYKYQKADELLKNIDNDIKKDSEKNIKIKSKTKIVVFYSPYQSKDKIDKLYKLYRHISKKKNVLLVDLDEYNNFMGDTGFSNIIYKYKENLLTYEAMISEIKEEEGIKIIKGVSYPEDYAVINNVDLSNIISEFREIEYDYIFVDCDISFLRNQYLFVDCDYLLVFDGGKQDTKRSDIFMKYIEEQNMINIKKVKRFNKDNNEKQSIQNVVYNIFGE